MKTKKTLKTTHKRVKIDLDLTYSAKRTKYILGLSPKTNLNRIRLNKIGVNEVRGEDIYNYVCNHSKKSVSGGQFTSKNHRHAQIWVPVKK